MQVRARLLKVGSMAESLGVYVPAMMLQKTLGLARILLFAHLMPPTEYGLWGLGLMIFLVASPVATMGANHGLTRYVSLYEARSKLAAFYHRVRVRCVLTAVVTTAIAVVGSGWITKFVIVSGTNEGGAVLTFRYQLYVCLAALANVLVGALYHDMLSFLFGMRAYRLASAAELVFSVIFTLFGLVGLALWPSALTLLAGHFLAQSIVLVAATVLLQAALKQAEGQKHGENEWALSEADAAAGEGAVLPSEGIAQPTDGDMEHAFRRVLRFGFVAMIGNILWLVAQHISLYVTNRHFGKEEVGVFSAFLQLSQGVLLVSNAAFGVVFAHVARRWEAFSRSAAMETLETAYKAATIALMAVTVLVYLTGPGWVLLLPEEYHEGVALLGGLLMFFQAISNLALLTAVARLREQPIVIAIAALVGGIANIALALWWVPRFDYGPAGAAWAAGVGMMVGGTAVTVIYFLLAGIRLHPVTFLLLFCPLLLLLPGWIAAAAWAAVILLAFVTPLFFDPKERHTLAYVVSRVVKQFRGRQS